jgi:SAM-dependent methyltransferase
MAGSSREIAAGRRPFEGIAHYYARFRPPWPEAVFTQIRERFGLDGTGRLLDLGCGTGYLTLPLAAYVEEAIGLDPEPEMLAEAARASSRLGVRNVRWLAARAEALADPVFRATVGSFRLATMGVSFHWMDRERVLAGVYEALTPGGGLAIVGQDVSSARLRRIVDETLAEVIGPSERHPDRPAQTERHEAVVARSPFRRIDVVAIPYRRVWSPEQVIGWAYSFSSGTYFHLGDRRPIFERRLGERLAALDAGARFTEDVRAELILAWKR